MVSVQLSPGDQELLIITRMGQAIRFNETDARSMGRTATGVKGISLREGDAVVAMASTTEGTELLVVTDFGYGKRTRLEEYPTQGRGGQGVKTLQLTEKTGPIVGAMMVTEEHEMMVSTLQGTVIRLACKDISVIGRATQGVRIIRLGEGDGVGAVTRIIPDEDEGIADEEGLTEGEEAGPEGQETVATEGLEEVNETPEDAPEES